MSKNETTYAIDNLRAMVRYFDLLDESFNQRWCLLELHAIWRHAKDVFDGDVLPDTWDPETLMTALANAGLCAPEWLKDQLKEEVKQDPRYVVIGNSRKGFTVMDTEVPGMRVIHANIPRRWIAQQICADLNKQNAGKKRT